MKMVLTFAGNVDCKLTQMEGLLAPFFFQDTMYDNRAGGEEHAIVTLFGHNENGL